MEDARRQQSNYNNWPKHFMGDFANIFDDNAELERVVHNNAHIKSFNLIFTYGGGKWDQKKFIPSVIKPIIDCSPMRHDSQYYYWRAVSATYLIRPNPDTLDILARHSTLPIGDFRECVSMFVRHGDKGIEMKLLQFSDFHPVVQRLWDDGLVPASRRFLESVPVTEPGQVATSPFGTNGTMFITTEDPAVLHQAEEWGHHNGWKVTYTDLFNRSTQTAYKTWDEQHKKGTVGVHDELEYISMLLNLMYSLKCEAWVCTLASNSCRVIDELRATIGAKANRFYADLSIETCPHPPCIGDGIDNFSFRLRD